MPRSWHGHKYPKAVRRRRPYPYYKVQVLNEVICTWKDERKIFDTPEAAQEYIEKQIAPKPARIMEVYRDRRRVLAS